jgi:glycosyltransferase involved in cell wall biosynthesis
VRILLDYRPALRERTGVGEYVHELARAVVASAAPHESLTLFSSSWKDRISPDAVPGAHVLDRRYPVSLLNFTWHRLGLPRVDRMTDAPFDVVHSAHPLLVPSAHAAQVITVHDLDFLDHPERTRREIRRDYPVLAASHAQRADHIVAVSEHTADDVMRRFGVTRSKITVAHPGTPGWTPREREPDAGTTLFLGTLEPRKNLGVLLDAYERLLSRLKSVPPLVLAGRATPDADELVRRAQRPPLAGHVRLVGYVQPDRRPEIYRDALVLVMPSHTEGFGIPAAEAMAFGVPVIAANRGALPETVGTAGRLFDPTNADALADALAAVLGDADLRREMREAGFEQARQFQWTATAARVRQAWSRALDHKKARRG